MAEERDRTMTVAIAGIVATAVVGLAGTVAAWLSAHDDRDAQRALAHDERTHDQRVAVYLDVISFVEGQERALYEYTALVAEKRGDEAPVGDTLLDLPSHFPEAYSFTLRPRIPWQTGPPTRLLTRLRLFGSPDAFSAFEKTQRIPGNLPIRIGAARSGGGAELQAFGSPPNALEYKVLRKGYRAFYDQIERFEEIAHRDVG